MNENNKYEQIKKLRLNILNLSFDLGGLVNLLESKLIPNEAKELVADQVPKIIIKIKKVIAEYEKQ